MKNRPSAFGKFFFLFISGLLPYFSNSQGLLWEISGNGLKKPSYLYGTMHMGDERILDFGPKVWPAFEKSKTLALELELDKINPLDAMKAMLMDSTSLADLVSEADYDFLENYFDDSLKQSLALYKKIKPLYLYAIIMEAKLKQQGQNASENGVDMAFLKKARASEKKVIGLETMNEQLSAIDSWPVKEQAEYIVESLRNPKEQGIDMMDEMTRLYSVGDLEGLQKFSEEYETGSDFEQNLIVKRNHIMAERLAPLLKRGPVFTAVGALHLPGNEGIINLLRGMGYTVVAL